MGCIVFTFFDTAEGFTLAWICTPVTWGKQQRSVSLTFSWMVDVPYRTQGCIFWGLGLSLSRVNTNNILMGCTAIFRIPLKPKNLNSSPGQTDLDPMNFGDNEEEITHPYLSHQWKIIPEHCTNTKLLTSRIWFYIRFYITLFDVFKDFFDRLKHDMFRGVFMSCWKHNGNLTHGMDCMFNVQLF